MLRENLWNKSVDDCFAGAPAEVQRAVALVKFSRREHPPVHMRDFYADLSGASIEHATRIVEYMQQLGMDADVPRYAPQTVAGYFDRFPQ